jgi:hypothetical protein
MVHAAVDLVRKRGVLGLFSGVGITLAEIVPYAGVQFGVYDFLTRISDHETPTSELSSQAAFGRKFLIGLMAGFAGKACSGLLLQLSQCGSALIPSLDERQETVAEHRSHSKPSAKSPKGWDRTRIFHRFIFMFFTINTEKYTQIYPNI